MGYFYLKLGISLMQLTIASESQMVQEAKRLIERVQQEHIDDPTPPFLANYKTNNRK